MSLSRILANIGTALDSASTGDFLSKVDSDGVFGGVAYSSVTGTPTVLDSANVTNLIDSSYIQLRQSAVASGGLDSAGVTAILDSDYITNITTASGFQMFEYDATAGQTEFTGSDVNGNTLAYSEYGLLVHYNGILLSGATDYTATDGTTVVLTDSADADARITIAKWSLASAGGGAIALHFGDRGLSAGGYSSSNTNNIDYYDITTPGNASDFGDLTRTKNSFSSLSDTTYGVFGAGALSFQVIDYVTVATTGNATDFGDAFAGKSGATSDGSKGLFAGGFDNVTATGTSNAIEYITIATPSNASDFGDLLNASQLFMSNGMSDDTYGVFWGGSSSNGTMEYVTIQTPGNSTAFGNLTSTRANVPSCTDDASRGLLMGGLNSQNVIDYITISTPGNSTDFGDLTVITYQGAATSNSTRAVLTGGRDNNASNLDVIQYVTVQTPGNATDFGDLTVSKFNLSATSGSPS